MKESDVFQCLETGAQELGTLLGYGPNTEELTCDQLVQRWFSKTTGAGLTPEDAATFLAHRLAEELWELQEVQGLTTDWDGDPSQRVCVGASQEAGE